MKQAHSYKQPCIKDTYCSLFTFTTSRCSWSTKSTLQNAFSWKMEIICMMYWVLKRMQECYLWIYVVACNTEVYPTTMLRTFRYQVCKKWLFLPNSLSMLSSRENKLRPTPPTNRSNIECTTYGYWVTVIFQIYSCKFFIGSIFVQKIL